MNKKLLTIILLLLVLAIYLYLTDFKKVEETRLDTYTNYSTTTTDTDVNKVNAILITKDGMQKYINEKFKLSFNIPKGFYFSPDYLSDGVIKDNFIQMFNYIPEPNQKYYKANQNKIEGLVTNISKYSTSSEDIYLPQNLKTYTINIADKIVNVAEGSYGDTKFKTYYILLKEVDKYLNISIYGDEKNFVSLDEILKSI